MRTKMIYTMQPLIILRSIYELDKNDDDDKDDFNANSDED